MCIFIFLFATSFIYAQEKEIFEYQVPTIEQWQFKPITHYPCLILLAEEKEKLKANYYLLPEYEKKLNAPIKIWLTDGSREEKQKATQNFIKYWKEYNRAWNKTNLCRDQPAGVAMRGIWRCIHQYDIVQSLGLLSQEDINEFRDSLVKSIELAIGNDAKHPKIPSNTGFRHMNIWSDVVIAAGTVGLAFSELSQAKDWVEKVNALYR